MRVLCVHQEPDSKLYSLEAPVHARGHALEVWPAYRGDPLPDVSAYGAVFALGGVVHPDQDDQHAWLEPERRLLRDLVQADVPTLAICLGGQLLAQALGARAHRLDAVELGWVEIQRSREGRRDPLLGAFPDRFPAFEWHQYGFTVPDGAISLAASPDAPEQAFRFAEHAWGLQFHIEASAETIDLWTLQGLAEIESLGGSRDAILADTARYAAEYAWQAEALSHRFLARAEERAAPRRASA
jgi:GMP synthase-like glutamine amidotransferase